MYSGFMLPRRDNAWKHRKPVLQFHQNQPLQMHENTSSRLVECYFAKETGYGKIGRLNLQGRSHQHQFESEIVSGAPVFHGHAQPSTLKPVATRPQKYQAGLPETVPSSRVDQVSMIIARRSSLSENIDVLTYRYWIYVPFQNA